jgi:Domain of unknown function (DUF4965)
MLDSSVADQFLLIESANMLIMTYAYARASGDGSLISRYVRRGSTFCLQDLMDSDSTRC